MEILNTSDYSTEDLTALLKHAKTLASRCATGNNIPHIIWFQTLRSNHEPAYDEGIRTEGRSFGTDHECFLIMIAPPSRLPLTALEKLALCAKGAVAKIPERTVQCLFYILWSVFARGSAYPPSIEARTVRADPHTRKRQRQLAPRVKRLELLFKINSAETRLAYLEKEIKAEQLYKRMAIANSRPATAFINGIARREKTKLYWSNKLKTYKARLAELESQ